MIQSEKDSTPQIESIYLLSNRQQGKKKKKKKKKIRIRFVIHIKKSSKKTFELLILIYDYHLKKTTRVKKSDGFIIVLSKRNCDKKYSNHMSYCVIL